VRQCDTVMDYGHNCNTHKKIKIQDRL